MILEATITCPHCGHAERETMPRDACQYLYDCKGCGALLRPEPGDCCVFCSCWRSWRGDCGAGRPAEPGARPHAGFPQTCRPAFA